MHELATAEGCVRLLLLLKQFDALRSAAFDGTDELYALGDNPEHRFNGVWSDGIPVRELKIQKAAPVVP